MTKRSPTETDISIIRDSAPLVTTMSFKRDAVVEDARQIGG